MRVERRRHADAPDHSGLALEEVTEKMSKSRGNVVNPDDVIAEYGTDAMRLYEMFMGPLDKGAPWSTDSIPGVYRFLQRAYRLVIDEDADGERPAAIVEGAGNEAQARLTAKTIHGVTQDIEEMQFNTAISKLMVFVRDITKEGPLPRDAADTFLLLLSPSLPISPRSCGSGSATREPRTRALADCGCGLARRRHGHARRPGERQAPQRDPRREPTPPRMRFAKPRSPMRPSSGISTAASRRR